MNVAGTVRALTDTLVLRDAVRLVDTLWFPRPHSWWRDVPVGLVVGFVSGLAASLVAEWLWRKHLAASARDVLRRIHSVTHRLSVARESFSVGPLELDVTMWRGLAIKDKGDRGWRLDDVEMRWTDETKAWNSKLLSYVRKEWAAAGHADTRQELEADPRCGVWKMATKMQRGQVVPTITLYRTDYDKFLVLNQGWRKLHDAEFDVEQRVFQGDGYKYLERSLLSNDLGTGTTVITSDNKVILSDRTQKHAVLRGLYHTSIHEGMLPKQDLVGDAKSPFATIVRGARHEMELTIDIKDVRVLAFCMYRPFAQPYIVAEVRVPETAEKVMELAKKRTNPESTLVPENFSVRGLAVYLLGAEKGPVTADSARLCLLLSLISHYGREQVAEDLYREAMRLAG